MCSSYIGLSRNAICIKYLITPVCLSTPFILTAWLDSLSLAPLICSISICQDIFDFFPHLPTYKKSEMMLNYNNRIITIMTLPAATPLSLSPRVTDRLSDSGQLYVTQVSMRMRLTEGLSLSSAPEAGGRPRPSGEWKLCRWSSRSLPS